MSLLLSPPRISSLGQSLQTFSEYRASERSRHTLTGTGQSGELLEYETLALRLSPPAVEVCNESVPGRTVLTISSANRSGTLVEVVQGLTELGLEVHTARISSDGGWFVDVFEITEADGSRVEDAVKLMRIQHMLDVHTEENKFGTGDSLDDRNIDATVFELAGQDRAGLLADITDLMTANNCHVCSAAVWTYLGRVAFVLSVTDGGKPIPEAKLRAFRGRLMDIMDQQGNGVVRVHTARGEVHHDRRLHQLMLLEATQAWTNLNAGENAGVSIQGSEMRVLPQDAYRAASSPTDSVSSLHESLVQDFRSPKHSTPIVRIAKCSDRKYWLVNIECKDRNKLLFDTVCTLADMNYDVYHASIDSVKGQAVQEYYVRSRHGCSEWCDSKASMLKGMLEASIQRRFPKGLKVHVRSLQNGSCLTDLAQRLRAANLSITRAKVRPYSKLSGQTLYLMGTDGTPPDPQVVEEACRNLGGILVDRAANNDPDSIGDQKFTFSFLERQWKSTWGVPLNSPGSSVASSG